MNQLKIYLPPPVNWQDFQSLVRDIATSRYSPSTVIEYGGQGQRQNGVDVYARDHFENHIGIQCKETKVKLTEKSVRKEADAAKCFNPRLNLFVVATTERTNVKLQDRVNEINASTVYPFTIRVEFWNDLVNDINRYAMVLSGCYQSYRTAFQKTDESNHLECLRVAFDRPAFKDDFMHERNYEDFEEALVSTKRLLRTGFASDRWSQIPIVQTVPLESLPDGSYRTKVSAVERSLEGIYKDYIADRTKIAADSRYAGERAGHYNIQRRKLLFKLNGMLLSSGLPEIHASYA